MVLYSDEYQTIRKSSQASIMELNWTSATSKLIDANYKKRVDNIVYFIEQSKPTRFLADLQNLIYTASFQFLPLFNADIRKKLINAGLQKLAFVKSDDVLTQLLVDQFIKKIGSKGFTTRYFDDAETAKAWLSQSN